jgi:indole-3-glycerol phosphate synthase
MAATYLSDILAWHRRRVSQDARSWRDRTPAAYTGPSMLAALAGAEGSALRVVAEVKRRSPSRGWIDEDLDPAGLATAYERGGAAAVSVLTDEAHFAGSRDDFDAVRAAVRVPVLRKDFILSVNDVLDSAEMGAAAILLIVAALDDGELRRLLDVAAEFALDALVEVHDESEAERAVASGARLVGVNQRDLRTFDVDPARAAAVVGALPPGVTAVAESGLASVKDAQLVADAGFDAVLVGEAFVRAPDPELAVRAFASVRRTARG